MLYIKSYIKDGTIEKYRQATEKYDTKVFELSKQNIRDFEFFADAAAETTLTGGNGYFRIFKNIKDKSLICAVYLIYYNEGRYNFKFKKMKKVLTPSSNFDFFSLGKKNCRDEFLIHNKETSDFFIKNLRLVIDKKTRHSYFILFQEKQTNNFLYCVFQPFRIDGEWKYICHYDGETPTELCPFKILKYIENKKEEYKKENEDTAYWIERSQTKREVTQLFLFCTVFFLILVSTLISFFDLSPFSALALSILALILIYLARIKE